MIKVIVCDSSVAITVQTRCRVHNEPAPYSIRSYGYATRTRAALTPAAVILVKNAG